MPENLYFITMHFDRRFISDGLGEPRKTASYVVIDETSRWYAKVARKSFGKHIQKKVDLQPRGYAFVDFEGTRHWGPSYGGRQLLSGFPHVHCLLLMMPGQGQMFREVHDGAKLNRRITDIDIRLYDSTMAALDQLVSYCMKGYVKLPATMAAREDAMADLPRLRMK